MDFIGIGNLGTEVMRQFMDQPDVGVVALSDRYKPYLGRDRSAVDSCFFKYGQGGAVPKLDKRDKFGPNVKHYGDCRKLLEDKNVDAVTIATPDRQHAIITIDAIHAGKDVYCEKPLSATIVEGRAMVNAQKNSRQVVAVDLNRRGNDSFALLGNIAYRMGRRLEWNGVNECFTNCEKANELLHYKYREGYKLG